MAGMPQIAPVTLALLAANIVIYLLQSVTGNALLISFALWPLDSANYPGAPPFQVWQLITYGFLHGGLTHIFFNMFALYMFGSTIERLLGMQRYIVYYLTCVIGAGVAQLAVMHMMHSAPFPTVGASGGIFGLLLAFGMAYPRQRIMLLFPPIPMPAWLFVTLYGMLELYLGVTGTQQGVAHFAHLGGMAAGFLLLQLWRSRR